MIELYWLLTTSLLLFWATKEDFQNRLIPDKIWLLFIVVNFPVFLYWLMNGANDDEVLLSIINILLTIFISFILFIFGSFGGGDTKALILLAITTPISRDTIELPLVSMEPVPSVFLILLFLLLYFLSFAIGLSLRNLLEIRRYGPLFEHTQGGYSEKLNTLFSARRASTDELEALKHSDPAEIYDLGKWVLYAPVFQGPVEDDIAIAKEKEMRLQAIDNVKRTGRSYLWVRPQPPGLLFITLAYITWIILASPFSL